MSPLDLGLEVRDAKRERNGMEEPRRHGMWGLLGSESSPQLTANRDSLGAWMPSTDELGSSFSRRAC